MDMRKAPERASDPETTVAVAHELRRLKRLH
jgi:hypothetical protein